MATFTAVTPGTYTLTETTVPPGYTPVENPREISISATQNTFTVINQLIPNLIKIEARDQGGNPIPNAVYTVTNTSTNQKVGTYTTGADGTVTTVQLVAGNNYSIEQVSVPAEYASTANSPQTVSDLPNGTTTVTFTNTSETHTHLTVNLKKTNTTQNLSGGTFEVWTTGIGAMRIAGPVTTNADGNVDFGNLLNGRVYEIRQITAPNGYTASSPQQLDLTTATQNGTETLQFYNSDVTLTVNLKAQDTGENLSGAVFVAKENRVQVGTPVTTDANGNAVLSGLVPGRTYTIEEITPPAGYFPYAPAPTVTMDAPNKFLNLTNVPLSLTITLQTSGGAALPNTGFDVKDAGGTIVASGTTGAQGQIRLTGPPLIYGATYTVEQTSVVDGYTPAQLTIVSLNQQATQVNVQNGQTATLHITLYEAGTLTPLEGGRFIMKGTNGIIVGSGTTDAEGKFSVLGLTDGMNYVIEQTIAPAGYLPNPPMIIVMDGLDFYQPLFNTKGTQTTGSIRITAVDQDYPALKLAGATFVVTGPGPDGQNYPVSTNAQGEAILTSLHFGTYTIVQTGAPSGYVANGKNATVALTLSEPLADITVQNKNIGVDLDPGVIKTTVRDSSTQAPIPGVRMRATDEDGNTYLATTDGRFG